MEKQAALAALSALAQDNRLDIHRLLVGAGPAGLPAGDVGGRLGLPSATLSFHLKELRQAGLIDAERRGRSIVYRANFPAVRALLAYLAENCCREDASYCGPTDLAGARRC